MVKVKSSAKAIVVFAEEPVESFTDTEIVFEIPEEFRNDVKLFWEGRYSEFSEEAKTMIKAHSGLANDTVENGRTYTDARIHALYKDPSLVERLEEELGTTIDPTAELISKPKESEVWKPGG